MNAVALIRRKRDGQSLTGAEIRSLIDHYVDGSVPDYQMSAFLMAAFLRGMDAAETGALLDSMLHSGTVLRWSDLSTRRIDKHSTGGVGDKVSLILAPLAAACGLQVPMISGRGLGHTGGTLDKLESIPGFRTDLSLEDMRRQLDRIGVVMMGQTDDIAPADRKIYALRDVTSTVEFIPFITASILSKKLAAGLDGLVLDVKTGDGAFMAREEDARRLAEALTDAGERHGCPTVARLTRMESPLGRTIGNFPEVEEAISCLQGQADPELTDLSVALTAEMLVLGGQAPDLASAMRSARHALDEGNGLERLAQLIEAQGGDPAILDHTDERMQGACRVDVRAGENTSGYVFALPARAVGEIGVALGAGRARKEDAVDPIAGIYLNKKPGDPVEPGSVLATVVGVDERRVHRAAADLLLTYRIEPTRPSTGPLLIDRYQRGKWASADTD